MRAAVVVGDYLTDWAATLPDAQGSSAFPSGSQDIAGGAHT